MLWPKGNDVLRTEMPAALPRRATGILPMQPPPLPDDKQSGLNDVPAIIDHDPARVMLEPPNLHVDPVDRAMALAAELPAPDPALRAAQPLNDKAQPLSGKMPPVLPPQRTFGRSLVRGGLAIGIGAAVTIGLLSYGEAARQMLAAWAPQLASVQHTSVKVAEHAAPVEAAAQPPAVAAPTPPPAPQPAAAPPVAEAPAAAATDPRIEEMAREIATLRETIEQLKSGQQQMSRDLAKVRDAKAGEPEPRRKTATTPPPPKPAEAASRGPSPQPAYAPPPREPAYGPPPQRQVYVPPRDEVYVEPPRVYTPPPPRVYVPPPPQVYAPPPYYESGAPRPPRPLP